MDKGAVFRKLHEAPGAFVIPNPWDIGTAKLLAASGFKALARPAPVLPFRAACLTAACPSTS